MGRIVRKVSASLQHPKDENGKFIPLFDGACFAPKAAKWDEENAAWNAGFRSDGDGEWIPLDGSEGVRTFAEWDNERPDSKDYMPQWSDAERTHSMMYEDTTEGTPLSHAFSSHQELARWLADSGASWFAGQSMSFDGWMAIIGEPSQSLPGFEVPVAANA